MRCDTGPPLVTFDFNGTLQDDAWVGYEYSVRRRFERAGLPAPTFDEYRREFTPADHMAFFRTRGLPGADDESAFYDAVLAEMTADDVQSSLFPEVLDVLTALRDRECPMTIVSVLNQETLDASVHRHGIRGFFRAVQGSVRSKGATIATHHAAFGNGTPPIVVGDTIDDARAAVMAGAVPVVCPRGIHHIDCFSVAQAELPTMVIIGDLTHLLRLLP